MRALLFVLFLAFALAVGMTVPPEAVPQFAMRHEAFFSMYSVVSALLFVVVYALAFGFTVPVTTVLSLGAGVVFEAGFGVALVMAGTILGALAVFLSARGWARSHCERLLGERLLTLVQEARAHPISFLLSTRFAPLVPFPVAHIVPGLVPVPVRDFLWTTVVGTLPAAVAFVLLGASLMRASSGENHIVEVVSLALAALSVAVLLPVWWRWRTRRMPQ